MSHTHVPSDLCCPVEHPDEGGTGIEIGDALFLFDSESFSIWKNIGLRFIRSP